MSNISEKIDYQLIGIDTPLSIYGNNCLLSGGYIDFEVNDNIFNFKIYPLKCLLSKKIYIIKDSYNISLDCSSFNDNGKVLIFLHLINQSKLIYRASYFLSEQKILIPEVLDESKTDYIQKYPTILFGVFTFEKNNKNEIIDFHNITPDRFSLYTYSDPEKIKLQDKELDILPFDNVSKRISNLIINYTGGTGTTGNTGHTGPIGNTGGTGKTGNTGHIGKLSRLTSSKYKIFKQNTPDSVWKIQHNFNELYVQVQTYNQFDKMIQPKEIKLINKNYLEIFFGKAIIGTATLLAGPYTKDRDDIATKVIDIKEDTSNLYELAKKYTGGTGNTGSSGDMGEQGPPGLSGLDGPPGIPGRNGIDGPQGFSGNIGEEGQIGPTGPKGPKGRTGWPGIKGPIGETGNTGGTGDYDHDFLEYFKQKVDEFICKLYPIGFIYMSFVDELPELLKRCGNWEKLDKVFLYSSKQTNQTGGLEEVTLVEDEIPIHNLDITNISLNSWDSDHICKTSENGHTHNAITDYSLEHSHNHPDNKLTGGEHEHPVTGSLYTADNCLHITSKNGEDKDPVETTAAGANHTHTVEMSESGEHIHNIKISEEIAEGHFHKIFSIEFKDHTHEVKVDPIGKSKPHNNMPPYITCFMWKRVS